MYRLYIIRASRKKLKMREGNVNESISELVFERKDVF